MKTFRLILFLFVMLFSSAVDAQQEFNTLSPTKQKFRTVIKTNPFTIIWGAIPLTSEYRIVGEYVTSKNQSGQIGISYLSKSPILKVLEQDTAYSNAIQGFEFFIKGYRIQGMYKFYLTQLGDGINNNKRMAPSGFYVAPHASYASAVFTSKYLNQYDVYVRISHFNINAMMGVQFFIGNLAIDAFTGVGYKKNEWVEKYKSVVKPVSTNDLGGYYNGKFKFSLGFNIGWGIKN